jgi:predicted GNAT superfamily acetyltransferase
MGVTAFEIREIDGFDDIERCIELQRATWAMPDVDLTPARLFVVARHAGTPPLGAFGPDGRLLGFLHTLSARYEGMPAFYSHMLAVDERDRDAGVGHALKLEQRRRALEAGVGLVVWTFDPLQSRNAHLNINKLGVVVRRYVENFYGENHASVFDAGIGSDRVFAEWWVGSERVRRALDGDAQVPDAAEAVEIPSDFNAVRRASLDDAVAWRERTRRSFQACLARGLVATALTRDGEAGTSSYRFTHEEAIRDALR